MEKLLKLTQKIGDVKLRTMVVEFLNNPHLSNKSFSKYPMMDIGQASSAFTVGSGMAAATVEREVLSHTVALAELCDKVSDVVEKNYGLPIDRDALIAAAIVHDIAKAFEWKKGPAGHGLEHTGILLDHTMLGTAELYSRGFPEEVLHIVASHFGETGPTPPRNFEALIFHHLDNMISILEFRLLAPESQAQQAMQMIFLDDDTLKKVGLGENSDVGTQGKNGEPHGNQGRGGTGRRRTKGAKEGKS